MTEEEFKEYYKEAYALREWIRNHPPLRKQDLKPWQLQFLGDYLDD